MRCIVCAVLMLFPVTTASAAASWVPIGVDTAGAVIVHITINDSGPFPFLLDTGATHSVISDSLAERLKLQRVAATSVMTSTGPQIRAVARLNQTSIGSVRSDNILASIAGAPQLASIAPGIEGIIGQDFLFAFNYTLDYRRHRLIWSDDDAKDRSRLPLIVREGRYLVQVVASDTNRPVLLVPDSGANGFVIFASAFAPSGADRFGETGYPSGIMQMHSLSGWQHVRMMVLRELRIGSVTLRNRRVAVVPRDPNDVVEGDGLLPLHLFASVSFNARERWLAVEGREAHVEGN